jgi:hypothetical protein
VYCTIPSLWHHGELIKVNVTVWPLPPVPEDAGEDAEEARKLAGEDPPQKELKVDKANPFQETKKTMYGHELDKNANEGVVLHLKVHNYIGV